MISNKEFVSQIDDLFKAAILSRIPVNTMNEVFSAFADMTSKMSEIYAELDVTPLLDGKPVSHSITESVTKKPIKTIEQIAPTSTSTKFKQSEEEREKNRIYQREWYRRNQEKLRALKRDYYHKIKEDHKK